MATFNITNINHVQSGIPFYDAYGVVTNHGVQMLRCDKSSAVLVIATGTNATGEQMSLLYPGTAKAWVLSSTLMPM